MAVVGPKNARCEWRSGKKAGIIRDGPEAMLQAMLQSYPPLTLSDAAQRQHLSSSAVGRYRGSSTLKASFLEQHHSNNMLRGTSLASAPTSNILNKDTSCHFKTKYRSHGLAIYRKAHHLKYDKVINIAASAAAVIKQQAAA
ncbi:hypothetical protein Bbelb_073880 [Branchiostoma belcheri]|nr:hypothetical protein Bbelb_073880 [Branchiostoma belcheri]